VLRQIGAQLNPDSNRIPVGAAEGSDLLILILNTKVKRSQPSAAPTWGMAFS
jgi:hypothetical protein